jgi:hypothetical protein
MALLDFLLPEVVVWNLAERVEARGLNEGVLEKVTILTRRRAVEMRPPNAPYLLSPHLWLVRGQS